MLSVLLHYTSIAKCASMTRISYEQLQILAALFTHSDHYTVRTIVDIPPT